MTELSQQGLDDPWRDGPKPWQCFRHGEPHRPCWVPGELFAALGRRVVAVEPGEDGQFPERHARAGLENLGGVERHELTVDECCDGAGCRLLGRGVDLRRQLAGLGQDRKAMPWATGQLCGRDDGGRCPPPPEIDLAGRERVQRPLPEAVCRAVGAGLGEGEHGLHQLVAGRVGQALGEHGDAVKRVGAGGIEVAGPLCGKAQQVPRDVFDGRRGQQEREAGRLGPRLAAQVGSEVAPDQRRGSSSRS